MTYVLGLLISVPLAVALTLILDLSLVPAMLLGISIGTLGGVIAVRATR